MTTPATIPVIDIAALRAPHVSQAQQSAVAAAIGAACREHGFFYIANHGIDLPLQAELEALSRRFFALPLADKMQLAMAKGGAAWRGYFPVGGELTSGKPDLKEGLYFGEELPPNHPLVSAGTPLHGANQYPPLPGFKPLLLRYLQDMTSLGHTVLRGIALSLNLPADYFHARYTSNPLILFRIFNYPAEPLVAAATTEQWGVGEHTDYGLLTILKQDHLGGLQVKARGQWLEAPPIADTFVCNIGDMLDRMSGGRYRSTPHRVRNTSGLGRLSWPFFFDPSFTAVIQPIPGCEVLADDQDSRWDQASVHTFTGTYGDYLLSKVGRVFPGLAKQKT